MVIGWLLISLQNNIFRVNHPIGQGSEDSVAYGKSVINVLLFFVWLRERIAGGHFESSNQNSRRTSFVIPL